MGSRELLSAAVSRMTFFRRLNLLIAVVCPFVFVGIVYLIVSAGLLPEPINWFLIFLAALFLFYFLWRSKNLFSTIRKEEAAALIDRHTGAKERFLSIASISAGAATDESLLRAIETQADGYAQGYQLKENLNFHLEGPAKVSAWVTPIFLIILLLGIIYTPDGTIAPDTEALELGRERAKELLDFVQQNEELPPAVKGNLQEIASMLEEKGLYADEVQQELEENIEELDKLLEFPNLEELSNEKDSEQEAIKKQTTPSENQNSKNTENNRERDSLAKKDREEQPSEQSKVENKAAEKPEEIKDNSKSEKQSEPQTKDSTPGPDGTEEKKTSASKLSDGEQSQGLKQQESGPNKEQTSAEQAQSEQAKAEAENQKSGDERQQKEVKKQEEDPKKDLTGLGDGKGGGKSGGNNKSSPGETSSGNDESQAKEGEAKNDSNAPGSGNSETGSGTDKQEQKSAGSSSPAESSQGQKNKAGKIGQAKSRLEELKREAEGADKGQSSSEGNSSDKDGNKDSDKGKKSGGKDGQEDSTSKENKAGEQSAQGQKGSKNTSANKSSEKSGDRGSKGEQQGDSSAKKSSEKSGSDKASKASMGNQSLSKDKEGTDNKTDGNGSEKSESASEDGQSANSPSPDRPNSKTRSTRPNAVPVPEENARRWGPFSGGEDGNLQGKERKVEKVLVPEEEKIIVRGLGESDGKLYKNKTGAKAKTQLGEVEFSKPKAEVAESSQPIPVEYKDILR